MADRLKAPYFWTWDQSCNWKKNERGKQTMGCNNPYTKTGSRFVEDYTRAILWAAENGIAAVGAAGFLRDNHGGLDALRYVADFAKDHGVIFYGITGLAAYNGVYYDGTSEWSLENFLKANQDCMAVRRDGTQLIGYWDKTILHACLSKQKTRDFIRRSVEWLFKQVPSLGGLSMETSDSGICHCPECDKRRTYYNDEMLSVEDMAMMYPQCIDAIRSVNPDAMIICEIYEHFKNVPPPPDAASSFGWGISPEKAQVLSTLPKDVYLSWVGDVCMPWWNEDDRIPESLRGHQHLMRAHYGCQWIGEHGRHKLELENIRKTCYLSLKAGIERTNWFGESSVYNTNNELNYHAMVYFSEHPFNSVEDFLRDVAADMLGGLEAAKLWCEINERFDREAVTEEDVDVACGYVAHLKGETRRRWLWLSSFIASMHWDETALTE